MGGGGVPSGGVYLVYGKQGDLPYKGAKPNSTYKLYVEGKLVQVRKFDSMGRAKQNTDLSHGGNHSFPHSHDWDWSSGIGIRGKGY